MVIYELLLILIIFWFFTIIIRKDLFSPSSILLLSYILAICCAIYNIENWKISLHYNTFWVILIGIISFLIPSFLMYIKNRKIIKKDAKEINIINIKQYKILILNIISLMLFIIYTFYFIKAIGGISALSNFNNAMAIYRSKTLFHHINLIPGWINFLIKFCRAIAYVYTYILINNKIKTGKIKQKNYLLYIFGIAIYIPTILMSGGRYDLIVYILYIIAIWNILYTINSKKRLQPKKIIKIGFIIFIILIAFSNLKTIVGRSENNSYNSIDYITEYFGGSIEIFDMYMQDDHIKNKYFGSETFAGIRKFLFQIKIIENQGVNEGASLFRSIYNGKIIGNVYTGFRKMFQDFGIIGVIVLQFLMSIIFNKIYYISLYKKEKNEISFSIILMGSITFCLAFHSYSEAFYSTVLSFNYISFYILLLLIIKFLLKIEISK